MDEIELYLDEAKDLMNKAYMHVGHELGKIRAGKANPSMLDGIYSFLLWHNDSFKSGLFHDHT